MGETGLHHLFLVRRMNNHHVCAPTEIMTPITHKEMHRPCLIHLGRISLVAHQLGLDGDRHVEVEVVAVGDQDRDCAVG